MATLSTGVVSLILTYILQSWLVRGKAVYFADPIVMIEPLCESKKSCYIESSTLTSTHGHPMEHGPCSIDTMGSLVPGSLDLSVTYRSPQHALISAKWKYQDGRSPIGPLRISVQQGKDIYSFCVGEDVVMFETNITATSGVCSTEIKNANKITLSVYLHNPLRSIKQLTKSIFVEDCWSVMGNRSLDVCGVQVPSPPVNISAVLSVDSSTNVSTVTAEWSPPLYNNTPILYYLVEFEGSPSNRVFTNSTRVALEITPGSQNTQVRAGVRAGVRVHKVSCWCCWEGIISGERYIFGTSGRDNTSIVTQMSPAQRSPYLDQKDTIIAVLVLAGLIILFLLTKIFMFL